MTKLFTVKRCGKALREKRMTKAKQKIKVIDSKQLRDLVLNIDKEAYAKQKVEEALKKAKTDYIGAFNLGYKAGEKRINKQKQIEAYEEVLKEIEIWGWNGIAGSCYKGLLRGKLEQRIKKLKEASE